LLAGVLLCTVDSFPKSYLGLPLGAIFKEKFIYDLVIEKTLWWRAKYVFKGGRLILIKSVLTFPFTSSLFPIPLSVATKLEAI